MWVREDPPMTVKVGEGGEDNWWATIVRTKRFRQGCVLNTVGVRNRKNMPKIKKS